MTYYRHEFQVSYRYNYFEQDTILCYGNSYVYFYSQFDHAICTFKIPSLLVGEKGYISPLKLEIRAIFPVIGDVYGLAWFNQRIYIAADGSLTSLCPFSLTAVTHALPVGHHRVISSGDQLFLLSYTLNTIAMVDPRSLAVLKRIQLDSIPVSVFMADGMINVLTQHTLITYRAGSSEFPRKYPLPARVTALAAAVGDQRLYIATKQRQIVFYYQTTGKQLGSLQNAMKYLPIAVFASGSKIIVLSQANECLVHDCDQKSNRFSGLRADSVWHGWHLEGLLFIGLTARSIYVVPDVSLLECQEREEGDYNA